MTEQEIQEEVQARVEFKFNEFLSCLKNKVAWKYKQAFDMTRESQYAWQSFEEISAMVNKEMIMPTPYDEMAKRKKWEAKEKAVEKIVTDLNLRGRDYQGKIRQIVAAVEIAQQY